MEGRGGVCVDEKRAGRKQREHTNAADFYSNKPTMLVATNRPSVRTFITSTHALQDR